MLSLKNKTWKIILALLIIALTIQVSAASTSSDKIISKDNTVLSLDNTVLSLQQNSEGWIQAIVLDEKNGNPIPGALVSIVETSEINYTGKNGKTKYFAVNTPVASGEADKAIESSQEYCPQRPYALYTIFVKALGYQPAIYQQVPVSENEKIVQTIFLSKSFGKTTDRIKRVVVGDRDSWIDSIQNYYEKIIESEGPNVRTACVETDDKNIPPELPLETREAVNEWIDKNKMKAGTYEKTFGSYRVFLIAMGQQNTSGYAVKIRDVAMYPDKWIIKFEFLKPKADDMVAQAITYPYKVIWIPGDGRTVLVNNIINGQPFEENIIK